MRSKIKQFLGSSTANDTSSDQNLMPSTTPKVKLEGVSDVNKSVFDSMSEGQRSRVLSASVGTNVEGINVTENIQQQLENMNSTSSIGSLIKYQLKQVLHLLLLQL